MSVSHFWVTLYWALNGSESMKAPAGFFSLTLTERQAHILAALVSIAFCTTVSGVTLGKMIMTCSAHPV